MSPSRAALVVVAENQRIRGGWWYGSFPSRSRELATLAARIEHAEVLERWGVAALQQDGPAPSAAAPRRRQRRGVATLQRALDMYTDARAAQVSLYGADDPTALRVQTCINRVAFYHEDVPTGTPALLTTEARL